MRWRAKSLICFWLSYVGSTSSAWKNPKAGKLPTSHFSLFNCCLTIVTWQRAHLENLPVVFCHNKQCSFQPFFFFFLNLIFWILYHTDLLCLVGWHLFTQNFTPAFLSLLPGSSVFLQALADLANILVIGRHPDQVEGVSSVFVPLQDVRDVDVITGEEKAENKQK